MNIMVVDDNADIRALMRSMLTEAGHTVHAAENGTQAIDYLMVYKIDLIITDIVMPEIEGVELVLRLRQSNIPIISISGLPKETIVAEFMASLGIVGFLQKPFANEDLMRLVDTAAPHISRNEQQAE